MIDIAGSGIPDHPIGQLEFVQLFEQGPAVDGPLFLRVCRRCGHPYGGWSRVARPTCASFSSSESGPLKNRDGWLSEKVSPSLSNTLNCPPSIKQLVEDYVSGTSRSRLPAAVLGPCSSPGRPAHEVAGELHRRGIVTLIVLSRKGPHGFPFRRSHSHFPIH